MKNKLLFIAFILFSKSILAQKPTFHVQYSEPLAVFVFAKSLGINYGENPFKNEFKKSKYNVPKYTDLIAMLDTLQIDFSYQYYEYPYGSKIPGMTSAILKKNLIHSKNINDFKLRSVGLIPNSTLQKLADLLTDFTPVYNELIYLPNKEKFEKQLESISKFVETKNIAGYFETGLNFYNSSWDNSIPFEISFYPLPNSQGFSAEAFLNNAVSAIQTDMTDYNVLLSVMMHEIYHILYDEQPLKIKNEIADYFNQNPSKCSNYANLLLNEVLATAVGNGYVYEKLDGKIDQGEWYNWQYINLMAKKIYPTVLEYIEAKNPIDKNFIDTYIKLYEQNFPNWINEPNHTLTYRYVLSKNFSDFTTIAQLYPYCSMSEAEDQISELSIEKMKATPLTKVIIVSANHAYDLALIKKSFPELKKWKYRAESEFTHSVFLNDKSQLYIINQQKTPIETLLKQLNSNSK